MSEEKWTFLHSKCVEKSPLFLTHFCLPAVPVQKSDLTEQNEELRKKPFALQIEFCACHGSQFGVQ